jgi:hypothetical protein
MPCDKPCPQCPFARATPKSYLDTKGQNGHRFIGQSVGPFELPCHMKREFKDYKERFVNDEENPACIGAQIYRANLGISHLFPPTLAGEASPDYEAVFGGHDELLAHHMGIPLEVARGFLRTISPSMMLSGELAKPGVLTKPTEPG